MKDEDLQLVSARDDALLAVIVALVAKLDAAGIVSRSELTADLETVAGPKPADPAAESDQRQALRQAAAALKLGRVPVT